MPDIIIKINDATSRTELRETAIAMAASQKVGWEETYLREVLNVKFP